MLWTLLLIAGLSSWLLHSILTQRGPIINERMSWLPLSHSTAQLFNPLLHGAVRFSPPFTRDTGLSSYRHSTSHVTWTASLAATKTKKNKVVNQWWVFLLPKKDSKSSEIGRCEDVNTSVELRWHQRLPFLIDFRLHCWCFRYPAANPLRLEIYFTIYDMFEPHPRSGYSIFPVLKPWNWQILPEISIWTGLQPSSCSLVPASHGLCGIIPKCVQKRRFPNPSYFQYYLH